MFHLLPVLLFSFSLLVSLSLSLSLSLFLVDYKVQCVMNSEADLCAKLHVLWNSCFNTTSSTSGVKRTGSFILKCDCKGLGKKWSGFWLSLLEPGNQISDFKWTFSYLKICLHPSVLYFSFATWCTWRFNIITCSLQPFLLNCWSFGT